MFRLTRSFTSDAMHRDLGFYFSATISKLGKIPQQLLIGSFGKKRISLWISARNTTQTHLAQCLQIEQPQCKPLTPSKSAPQPSSAANGGGNGCCNSSRRSSAAPGGALPKCRSSFLFRSSTHAARRSAPAAVPVVEFYRAALRPLRALSLFALVAFAGKAAAQSYSFSSFASLYSTTGIAVDAAGTIYGTSFYNHTVLRISPTGAVTVLAGLAPSSGASDGAGSSARFNNPRAIAVNTAGDLFVADTGNHTIRKITPDGVVTTLAGLAGARGWDDGAGSAARFDAPQGIAVDSAGNVYVADTGTRTIRKITPSGAVTTLAGLGYVSGAKDGTGLDARFDTPQGIAVTPNGDVYVADTNNHAVRKITPAGVTTTFAGSLTNRGALDATGMVARFDSPQALTVDAAGNIFVADTNNYTLRKITSAAVVTTIGGLAGTSGDSAGIGGTARFNQSRGIAVTAAGVLYIADSYNVKTGSSVSQLAITVQPQNRTAASGSAIQFSLTATGGPPITYQWQKDGGSITGATTPTLTLSSVQASDTGSYTAVVSNSLGTLTSTAATLTVLSPLPNDNFTNAQVISGSTGEASGNNNGATGEVGEPTHVIAPATASSVWYRWTPTANGTAVFDLTSNFGVATAVYTGTTLGDLVRVTQSMASRFTFSANAGTTYFIALGSSFITRGNITLRWRMIANDAFANAQVITGSSGQVIGTNNGATSEPGEPNALQGSSASQTSVWYRWTAPQTGTLVLSVSSQAMTPVVTAYTGNTLNALQVAGGPVWDPSRAQLVGSITAGTTYSIAVGSYNYGAGDFTLNWNISSLPVFPLNLAGATVQVGAPIALSTTAVSPFAISYQWHKNGVPISGATSSSYNIPSAQVSDAGNYTVVATNNAGGVTSSLAVVAVLVPPTNDNYVNAQTITGLSGSISGSNLNATGESGEPTHWNQAGTASSVWYRWMPSSSGLAVFDTVGSTIDTALAIYTGTSLTALTRLVQDDDRGGGRTSQVNFAATAGTTYYIAIGSSTGPRGNLTLGWQLSPNLAIATPPASQTIAVGGSATFSVQAIGTGVTYQWRRNGEVIPGATAPTLTVANVQGGSDASYTVTISSSSGTVTSAPATLTIAAPSVTALSLRNTRSGGSLLWGLAANGMTLVAVGNGGAIISSDDNGRTWTPRVSGTTAWIVGVTYGAGQFVAVADGGLILTSPDGITWAPARSSGTTQRLNNVLYADGKFVAVGEGGTVVTSTDAQIWTPRLSGTTNWLHGLAYNSSIRHFAATGQGGVFLYSPDGVTWTKLTINGLSADLEAVVAVDSYAQFVAIGQDGVVAAINQNNLVLKTGETLITWSGEFNQTGTSARLRGLAQGASALFATGEDGKVITATDHRGPWYTVPSGTSGNLLAGIFHNNALFIVGENETALQSDALFSSRMINISTRGQVGTGSNLMISGFVIGGNSPKSVLVRAAGPTLSSSFNLPGVLNAPVLTLVDSQNRNIGSNTGWGTATNSDLISSTAARVGAFPFAANSADSAILTTLQPGAYTALIAGAGSSTGLSIVEVYDADVLSNEGSRAINISTRGVAGAGASKMIAGFVINGASSRRVLIRAVGPGISGAPFNVSGTLSEPLIELYNSRNLLHASAGAWGLQNNADEIRGTARAVGAFELTDGSKDSAMLLTLLPGAWTVQVGGAGEATGVVLVEVYALP